MRYCCICKKKKQKLGESFFKVPTDDRRVKWSKICSRDFCRTSVICIDHFAPSNYVKTGKRTTLLPTAVPIMPISNPVTMCPMTGDHYVMEHSPKICHTIPIANEQTTPETLTSPDVPITIPTYEKELFPLSLFPMAVEQLVIEQPSQIWYMQTSETQTSGDSNIPMHVEDLFSEKQTQTDPVALNYAVERKVLLNKVQALESEIKDLKCKLEKANF